MSDVVYINKYYQEAFSKNTAGSWFAYWNWSAFFFGASWLAYRKMYLQAIGIYIISLFFDFLIFIGILTKYGHNQEIAAQYSYIATFFTGFLLHLFFGVYGTALYGKLWLKNPVPHEKNESLLGYFFLWLPACAVLGFIVNLLLLSTFSPNFAPR